MDRISGVLSHRIEAARAGCSAGITGQHASAPCNSMRNRCEITLLVFVLQKDFPPDTVLASLAEWLRRMTRNHLGSPRIGSNPVGCDLFDADFNIESFTRPTSCNTRLYVHVVESPTNIRTCGGGNLTRPSQHSRSTHGTHIHQSQTTSVLKALQPCCRWTQKQSSIVLEWSLQYAVL